MIRRLGALAFAILAAGSFAVASVGAAPPDTTPPDAAPIDTAPIDPNATTVPPDTVEPEILDPDTGAATPAPVLAPSAPLIQVPTGCPTPPTASVVFVATLVAKDRNTARYQVEHIRAGSAISAIVGDLIDIRYDDETQYLEVGDEYLVGAGPSTSGPLLTSKVAETDLLFGGNAVIGLTEKNNECPVVDDPVRTLRPDGTEVETSLFTGLKDSKRDIAMAFVKPLAVAFAVILALVLVRWLFTAIFVSVRRAADGEPITDIGPNRRRHLPDL